MADTRGNTPRTRMRAAPERDVNVTIYDPLVMGVDVARYGDDKSVSASPRPRCPQHQAAEIPQHRHHDPMR